MFKGKLNQLKHLLRFYDLMTMDYDDLLTYRNIPYHQVKMVTAMVNEQEYGLTFKEKDYHTHTDNYNKVRAQAELIYVLEHNQLENRHELFSQICSHIQFLTRDGWLSIPTINSLHEMLGLDNNSNPLDRTLKSDRFHLSNFYIGDSILNQHFSLTFLLEDIPTMIHDCYLVKPTMFLQKHILSKAYGKILIINDYCHYITDMCARNKAINELYAVTNEVKPDLLVESIEVDLPKNSNLVIGAFAIDNPIDFINSIEDGEYDVILIGDKTTYTDWLKLKRILKERNFTKTQVCASSEDYFICKSFYEIFSNLYDNPNYNLNLAHIANNTFSKQQDKLELFKKDYFTTILNTNIEHIQEWYVP